MQQERLNGKGEREGATHCATIGKKERKENKTTIEPMEKNTFGYLAFFLVLSLSRFGSLCLPVCLYHAAFSLCTLFPPFLLVPHTSKRGSPLFTQKHNRPTQSVSPPPPNSHPPQHHQQTVSTITYILSRRAHAILLLVAPLAPLPRHQRRRQRRPHTPIPSPSCSCCRDG